MSGVYTDIDTLRRSRGLWFAVAVLLSMWLFGNVYEELVTIVAVLAEPRPGAFPDALEPGSPVFYYLPWGPLGVALTVVLRLRFGAAVSAKVRRTWNTALVALAIGVGAKVLLIVTVNPRFRDPSRSEMAVAADAVLWAFGNGLAIVGTATALALFALTRRPQPPAPRA
ncbi:hypothetical protein [Stackebrandtia nassauensis]|uniref:Uncharacterized protein n=1 Tax=Stackebrandtia nassauensis (strain DSM 44728 / CIP 108903 / NRRL B-16338 / NBRC 102104 / LLR-40K-21) TaxID=446470 RepID=D3Q7M9_STANL|nr:hypothetical protein [Stackebrandtia nassauensis]ADD44371.1 hypothetical protein Snas_4729 [Stackebrandtia nassauensis DSM 44728]